MPRLHETIPAAPATRRPARTVTAQPSRRAHTFRLAFDDGHHEDVVAMLPSEAVALRDGYPGSRPPHTISDLDAIAAWVNGARRASSLDTL